MITVSVIRKPVQGNVAGNVLEHGGGGLNIDASRVGSDGGGTNCNRRDSNGKCMGHPDRRGTAYGVTYHANENEEIVGRFPANLICCNSATDTFPERSNTRHMSYRRNGDGFINNIPDQLEQRWFVPESGSASRYFYSVTGLK